METESSNCPTPLFADNAATFLLRLTEAHPDFFLLCDTNTRRHCLPFFEQHVRKVPEGHLLCIQSGERHKNMNNTIRLWQRLQQAGARRDSLLLNLGGGVICDMGGFVAGTWKRGMPFVHIPTSLMAQADAAIGGKCALDFGGVKNQIGLFRQPEALCIFPELLETLPERELRSGFAEMLKHGIIADAAYFNRLKRLRQWSELLLHPEWVRQSIEIKSETVRRDFTDTSERKALNFGHSIGHVLEAIANGRLSHGEAVAHGMRAEALIAQRMRLLPAGDFTSIENCLRQFYGPFPSSGCSMEQVETLLNADKKNDGRSLNFSLPVAIGMVRTDCPVTMEQVWDALMAFYIG